MDLNLAIIKLSNELFEAQSKIVDLEFEVKDLKSERDFLERKIDGLHSSVR